MAQKKLINPSSLVKPLSRYSHAIKVTLKNASLIFVTGQIAVDKDGNVVGQHDVTKQSEFVFEEIKTILAEAGSSLDDVVKANVYLTNMADFPKFSDVRNRYFLNTPPASTLVEVKSLVKEGCIVEIEVVAVVQ